MATDWVAAVSKIKGYVDTYLALSNPTPRQKAALRTDLATLDADLAGLAAEQAAAAPAIPGAAAAPPAVVAVRLSADQVWAKFLAALEAKQTADGVPVAAPGFSGHAYDREQNLAILASLGIPDALAILEAGGYHDVFGPTPAPGVSA